MKKILWIADFSVDEIAGGGELVDAHLLSLLDENYETEFLKASTVTTDTIKQNIDSIFIVSNFVSLSPMVRKYLQNTKYFIVEHDHKYLKTRDPSPFTDLIAPKNVVINRSFYKNAVKVFCQSTKHGEVVEKNLKIDNIISFGSTFWSQDHMNVLEDCATQASLGKTKDRVIIQSTNMVKGQRQAEAYCKDMSLGYELMSDPNYESFIKKLSEYSSLIFLPQVYETFSRLAVEARIVGCSMVGNQNISAAYEPWFKLKGKDLLEQVKKQQAAAESLFLKEIDGVDENYRNVADITVILNMYRRPDNMPMQVSAINKQTIRPKEIWTWVNAHEDNEKFDREKLDVDKIFDNNHNWKFYGRFAGALLADTEYVAIFDDDTIPGDKWFENCLETMKTHEGILGSAGIILKDNVYVKHDRCGWPTQNQEIAEVDLVGHAWFFKREWLQYLWKEKPPTWDNGEDIQFSFMAQKHGGVKTYCPPHPPTDPSLHGSVLGNELGIDSKATSNNNETSHQQFFTERDMVVQNAIKNGWKTVKGVKL
tara:strand:- start:4605 stop:6215 length:1611 start_codon:yes stop_codon:yes gene_type:complete